MTGKKYPRGIEKIIALAALDPRFRKSLFADREEALDNCKFQLSRAERAIFQSISNRQLRKTIERVRVPKHARHLFIKGAVAAALALIAGAGLVYQTTWISFGCTVSVEEVKQIEPTDEEKAVSSLLYIADAQIDYQIRHGTYTSTLRDLLEKKKISPELASGKYANYSFQLTNVTKDSFQLRALPEKDGFPAFFVDETCVVRFSNNNQVGPKSKPLEE